MVLKDTIRTFDVMEGVISFLEMFITNYQKKISSYLRRLIGLVTSYVETAF